MIKLKKVYGKGQEIKARRTLISYKNLIAFTLSATKKEYVCGWKALKDIIKGKNYFFSCLEFLVLK